MNCSLRMPKTFLLKPRCFLVVAVLIFPYICGKDPVKVSGITVISSPARNISCFEGISSCFVACLPAGSKTTVGYFGNATVTRS